MGPVNSARMHCSQLTKSTIAGLTKKKKKKKRKTQRRNADASFIAIQTGTIYLYVRFYEGRTLENKCIGS